MMVWNSVSNLTSENFQKLKKVKSKYRHYAYIHPNLPEKITSS
jgi:hypothetical protein